MKTLILASVLLLQACAFSDGYQFGDVTRTLVNARNIYCSPAVSDEQRQAAKARLDSMGINTGEESVCALTIEVLVGKMVEP